MTDCCLSPRAEGMTAHTARCLLTQHPVAHLRELIEPAHHTRTEEETEA